MQIEKLTGARIDDIIQTGVFENEGEFPEITLFHVSVYLEMDDSLIKFTSINQYSALKIEPVESFVMEVEVEMDMIPIKCSIKENILDDTFADNTIKRIDIYNYKPDENSVICDSISILLECGQTVFFDPTFIFGINIGGNRQFELWKDNLSADQKAALVKTSF